MGKKDINEILQRNVAIMAAHSEKEDSMMPATGAPLPSVEEVKRIVQLSKVIIFTDYFHKRQSDEQMRSHHIGVSMDELVVTKLVETVIGDSEGEILSA